MLFKSRCYRLKLLPETFACNDSAKEVSAGVAPCNVKGRNFFGNVKTGLKMLFSPANLFWTLAMNHGQLDVPFFDRLAYAV